MGIKKIADVFNGYMLTEKSTNRDLQMVFAKYEKVRCVVCNAKTAKAFSGTIGVTINNTLLDGVFYINGIR